MASINHHFSDLCNDIFALSPKIRFVGVINKMGKLVAGGMRDGGNPLENKAAVLEIRPINYLVISTSSEL